MAKISALPELTAPTGSETVPAVDAAGVTRRASMRALAEAAVAPTIARAEALVEHAQPSTLNRRIAEFPQRSGFVATEIAGPFFTTTDEPTPTPEYMIEGGVLKVTGTNTGTAPRYWRVGNSWAGRGTLSINAAVVMTTAANNRGISVYLGNANGSRIHFMYARNGAIGVVDDTGAPIAAKGGVATLAGMMWGEGVTARAHVEVYEDGTGYIEAVSATGKRYRHELVGITERGAVGPSWLRSDVGEICVFEVFTTPFVAANLPKSLTANRRDAALPQRNVFVEGEIAGPYFATTDGLTTTPSWSIDAAGALVIAGDQSGTASRHWDDGRTWAGDDALSVVVEGVWSEFPNTAGPMVRIGGAGGAVHLLYGNNGVLGVYDGSGSAIAAKGGAAVYAGMEFAAGQRVRLRVVINPEDNTGYLEATNPLGIKQRHPIQNIIERGSVCVAARRAAPGKITRFVTRRIDPAILAVPALQSSNADLGNRVAGLENGGASEARLKPLPVLLGSAAINHLLFYGQSNSIGADAIEPISLTQPYANITFAGGPRAWKAGAWSYGPVKPLVEDRDDAGGSGSSSVPLGETPCSGAANYASMLMALDGIDPASHVILASTAGRGSQLIAELEKGSNWYNSALLPMITAAANLGNAAIHAVPWIQGERDANEGTPYATYLAKLLALRSDLELAVQTRTGATGPTYMLVVQVCKYATQNDGPARAMLDAMTQSDRIYTVAPSYRLPYVNSIHYSAVGAKLAGAYIGRAYRQMVAGYQPDVLRPISATIQGNKLRVRFDVPHAPLRLDTANLAPAADFGFRVTDDGAPVGLTNVSLDGDSVILTLAAAPVGAVAIRYALDYTGSGRPAAEGSGNLRDSAPEKAEIGGTTFQLFNAAPAFAMPVTRLTF